MSDAPRLVLDTNVLVSAVLGPQGKPRRALEFALRRGVLLLSGPTRSELLEVLYRPRLQRYLVEVEREGIRRRIEARGERVAITERVEASRDPKDDKFLEVADGGGAGFIVSGDQDLLVLDPFRGIRILTPAAFLVAMGEEEA